LNIHILLASLVVDPMVFGYTMNISPQTGQ